MKICRSCGAQNTDDHIFCSTCGQRLESIVPPIRPYTEEEHHSGHYITFQRPQNLQMMVNIFHIKVDGFTKYELRNGGQVRIPVSPGQHTIEISVFGSPRKKQFQICVNGNMTFVCRPNPTSVLTLWALPVKITDSNGMEY